VQKFTESLAEATFAWHQARNEARKTQDLPPVIYSHYTPGPSGLNPGDPRTYAMAPNPGWKTMVTGAAILATAPAWVPVLAKGASLAYSACLTNPSMCTLIVRGAIQGTLKGGINMETGLPILDPAEYWTQEIFRYLSITIKD
ncbi:MAG: hypothetical protein R3257_05900, partial [bacterium]|nr:hypothetical protein [bacterium]